MSNASTLPVIIDSDVALDDWMATLYLLAKPSIQVIGITTTGVGAAHLVPGTRNIRGILAVGGHPEIPVAMGTSAPSSFSNVYPIAFRQTVDGAYGLALPQNSTPPPSVSAVQLLAELIKNSPSPVTILSIGGGTNLAMLLDQSPEVFSNVAAIYVMGGAIDVPGNVGSFNPDYSNSVAEWNIFVDPLAAQKLIAAAPSVPSFMLIPLDVCNEVVLDLDFYTALGAYLQNSTNPTAAARVVFSALTTQLSTILAGQYCFWDPLAAVILADTAGRYASTTTRQIAVNQTLNEGADTSGQTVVSSQGTAISVVTQVDAEGVKSEFFEAITGGATFPSGKIPMWPVQGSGERST